MTVRQLEAVIRDARALIDQRKEEESRRQRREARNDGKRWLAHQTRSCGRCSRCQRGGRPHGPYWVVFGYASGRKRSRHVGRRLPEELALEFGRRKDAGKTPEEVFPKEYHAGLAKAARLLAGGGGAERDGLPDAPLLRRLARVDFGRWTPHQRRAAWEMLAERRARLEEVGMRFGDLREPARPVAGMIGERAKVSEDGRVVLRFDFDEYLRELVRDMPGRSYNGVRREWRVPVTGANLGPLARFVAEAGLDFDAAVARRLREAGEQEAWEKLRRAQTVALSRAADASLEVPELGGELMPFQKAGVAYALRQKRTFVADEMGLGKTIQALAAVQAAGAYPALVVCPASVKLNWEREARKWLPGRSVEVLHGKGGKGVRTGAEVTVVNYELLGRYAEDLKTRGVRAIVLDESHYVKNPKARRTAVCRELAEGVPCRLLLTGTPVPNRPSELISQLEILGRLDEFGGFWSFVKRYCGWRDGDRYDFRGASNVGELNEKLRAACYVRRTKAEVLDELPPKQRAVLPVPIANRGEYRRAEQDVVRYLAELATESVARPEEAADEGATPVSYGMEEPAGAGPLVRIEKLKQLAARGKMGAVIKWVQDFLESGEKLVLFAHHKEVVRNLAERFGAPSITGDTPVRERQETVDRFQNDPNCRLVVLGNRAGGVGVTLNAASNVAFVELDWTPAAHDQAEDRCHRIGQARPVTAWYLLAEGTIDEEIHALVEAKRAVVGQVTEGDASAVSVSVRDELIERLRFRNGQG